MHEVPVTRVTALIQLWVLDRDYIESIAFLIRALIYETATILFSCWMSQDLRLKLSTSER